MSIIGTFPTTLTNGSLEDAAQVMVIFDWIKDQVNANAVAISGGNALLALNNTWTGNNNFNAGFAIGFVDFDLNTYASVNMALIDAGLLSEYSSSASGIIYGFASNVTRTGGNYHTVGGQFSGYANATNTGGTWGIVSQAMTYPNYTGDLIGAEFAIINQTTSDRVKIGCDIVFKDRYDGVPAITGALSTNLYNFKSKAINISSQQRSTTGEYCGWKYGIKFDEYSLDRDAAGPAYGIDFSNLHYYGGSDPTTAYRMSAAIRLRGLQSILWNSDANSETDPANPIRTYMDEFNDGWKITNSNQLRFAVNVVSGAIKLQGAATASPAIDLTSCGNMGGLFGFTSGNTMFSSAALGAYVGKVRVMIDGVTYYQPIYT